MTSLEKYRSRRGLAVVLSGPSGVGKDTLLEHFLAENDDCTRLVTCTTRPKRDYEADGVDYFFLSQEEFDRRAAAGQMLESATVHGYSYGSPREYVDQKRDEGLNVVLRIDVQGGMSVKDVLPDAVMVFLAPPSMEELQRRLVGRGSETAEQVAVRLKAAETELAFIPQYDYLVVHDSIEQASMDLRAIVTAERLRVVTQ